MRSLFFKIFLWFWAAQVLIGLALMVVTAATQRSYDDQLQTAIGASLQDRARAAAVAYELGGLPALRQAWRFAPGEGRGRRPRGFGGPRDLSDGPDRDSGSPEDAPPPPDEPPAVSRNDFRGSFGRSAASFFQLKPSQTASNGATAVWTPILLVGPPIPPAAAAILEQAQPNAAPLTQTFDGATLLAQGVETSSGARYVAVVALRTANRPGFLGAYFRFGPGPGGPLRFVVVALVMGAVCFLLARYLTDPAIKLRRATQQFAAGDLAVRVGPQIGRRRDELADLGRDFDLMAERIQTLLLSQQRLLGDISHELRSPLTRLKLALDLAEQSADPTTRSYLSRIEIEAEELNALIGQLLTLTRLESAASGPNQAETRRDYLDLGELVAHVCHNADFEARARGGSVQVVQNSECDLEGNGELLHSALENVVRNAILHSPGAARVEVSLQVEAEKTAIIRVRDYGPGVPSEALPLLFQPFYRVATARDRQSGGTGLGLSITQRAVQSHGGKVEAFNAPGGGLMMEIRLPIK
ncbi:MAG TPA: ATP-binding protein [Abditibacterium sp.]